MNFYVVLGCRGRFLEHWRACVCEQKRCCGVDGAWDYEKTGWYGKVNPVDVRQAHLTNTFSLHA